MFIDTYVLFILGMIIATAVATMAVFMAEDQQEIRDLKRDLRIKHGQYLEAERRGNTYNRWYNEERERVFDQS